MQNINQLNPDSITFRLSLLFNLNEANHVQMGIETSNHRSLFFFWKMQIFNQFDGTKK